MITFDSPPVNPIRVTSRFGPRNTGIAGASTYHNGIDLGANKALPETPIFAVRDGIVQQNYWNDTRGWVLTYNCVSDDGDKFRILVQHLKQQSTLKPGQTVKAGQTSGIMGASTNTIKGMSVHLHTELQVPAGNTWTPIDFLYQLEHIGEGEMTKEEIIKIIREELAASSDKPSSWADAWSLAKADGVTDGKNPGAYATREQVVQFIYRALGKVKRLN